MRTTTTKLISVISPSSNLENKSSPGSKKSLTHSRTSTQRRRILRKVSSQHFNFNEIDLFNKPLQKPEQLQPFQGISGDMEREYISLIDQIIVACDNQLNVVYNNYHERLYETIVHPIRNAINISKFRKKFGVKLEHLFKSSPEESNLEVDDRTLQVLQNLLGEFLTQGNMEVFSKLFPSQKSIQVANFIMLQKIKQRTGTDNTPKIKGWARKKNEDGSAKETLIVPFALTHSAANSSCGTSASSCAT